MAVKVHGVDRLLNELDGRLGQARMQSIIADAVEAGALVFGMELRRQLATFSDGKGQSQGYTLQELTIMPPQGDGKETKVIVHWKGSHNRYRIIHLNEWGTIKNPNPRGKGKIAKAMELSKRAYGKAIRDAIRRGI